MSPGATSMFDLYREQVEGIVQDGRSIAEVEQALDGVQLAAEERAALWLLAWSLRARGARVEGRAQRTRRPRALVLAPAPGRA